MAFEVFTRRMRPLVRKPAVTIQKRGTFSINAAAYAAMGAPEAVELLYDAENQVVGLRGVDPAVDHAYPLRPLAKQANGAAPKEGSPFVLGGTAFTQYYGIDTEVSRRYTGEIVDGVLCLDIKSGGTVVTSNRNKNVHSSKNGAADAE